MQFPELRMYKGLKAEPLRIAFYRHDNIVLQQNRQHLGIHLGSAAVQRVPQVGQESFVELGFLKVAQGQERTHGEARIGNGRQSQAQIKPVVPHLIEQMVAQFTRLRIPTQTGHLFRSKAATQYD
jgi:hypothetical protein